MFREEKRMPTNYPEAIKLLMKVAKYGEESISRDGYKKVNSGLISDIRAFLRDKEDVSLEDIE